MFIYKTTIKMHDTDAAGIIFFGNQFKWVHEAYESYLEAAGFSFATILRKTDFFIPIVHAEADFKSPLFVGDKITIAVKLEKIGQSSFVFDYTIQNAKQKIVGTAKTVHVTTGKKTHKKIPLPRNFRIALTKSV